jgi:hypothetical protein
VLPFEAPAGRSAVAMDRELDGPFSSLEAFSAEDGPSTPSRCDDLTIGQSPVPSV